MFDNRNPLIIPKEEAKAPGCPHCGNTRFNGRRIMGVLTYNCGTCHGTWQGGLPWVPSAPGRPVELPHTRTPLHLELDEHGQQVEERRGSPQTPDFRRGVPLPTEDE